jgi:hypothetical protein
MMHLAFILCRACHSRITRCLRLLSAASCPSQIFSSALLAIRPCHTTYMPSSNQKYRNLPITTPSNPSGHKISNNKSSSTMSSEDIASLLLHSADARIAAAAKRVFSSSYHPTASAVSSRSSSAAPPQYPYCSNDRGDGGEGITQHQASGLSRAEAERPLHGGNSDKHTAQKRAVSTLFEHRPSLEMAQDAEDEDDRKLSSTERLQRR